MSKETKPCHGVVAPKMGLHCPGCTSATERIAELEQEVDRLLAIIEHADASVLDKS